MDGVCMKQVLFSILSVAVLAVSVLAQEGAFLRNVDQYGANYTPMTASDLRLLEPSNLTQPRFDLYDFNEIVAAELTSGQYFLKMRTYFNTSLPGDPDQAVEVIKLRARQVCDVNGTPEEGEQLDCLRFYAEMGARVWELSSVEKYDTCEANIHQDVVKLGEQWAQGTLRPLDAGLQWAVRATGLKWCQTKFKMNMTVVAPTPENTHYVIPDYIKQMIERRDANTPPVMNASGPGTAPSSLSWLTWKTAGIVGGTLLLLAALYLVFVRPRN